MSSHSYRRYGDKNTNECQIIMHSKRQAINTESITHAGNSDLKRGINLKIEIHNPNSFITNSNQLKIFIQQHVKRKKYKTA